MVEHLRSYFYQLLKTVDNLHAIIITDREGVPLLKVADEKTTPEMVMRLKFLATPGMTMDQAGKLGLATNKTLIAMYSNYQVVCFNRLPLVVTMVAGKDANTGMILNLDEDIQKVLKDIRAAVVDVI